jgi:glycosyltransferase involved in cell wall biosynthesis
MSPAANKIHGNSDFSYRYVVITMVRNEEEFLPATIASMVSQTIRPVTWFVVDDGSVDRTPSILAEAAEANPWITVLRGAGREHRHAADAVSEGFNRVLPRVWELEPDAIVKLDGDMEFAPDYFERLLRTLDENPRLGIVGGRALEPHPDGTWGLVRISKQHVHGATHVFRRACLEQQQGLVQGLGWDTVTWVRARLAGWETGSNPDVTFRHLRVTGSASGHLRGFRFKGMAAYRAGYHPLFACLRGARNMVRYPYVLSGLAFLRGFLSGYVHRVPRALEPSEIRGFRKEQIKVMTGRQSWWR